MTQNQAIRKHLESGKSISPLMALNKFGCMRLASRIRDLKDAGMVIDDEFVNVQAYKYKKYFIPKRKKK